MHSVNPALVSQWDEQYQNLSNEIAATKTAHRNLIHRTRICIDLCLRNLEILKDQVKSLTFSDQETEIYFFKHVKPRVHGLLIFYSRVLSIELKKPTGGKHTLEQYYQKYLWKIKLFFDNHIDLYQYYRIGATYWDKDFFCRNKASLLFPDYYRTIDADPIFSTPKDYVISHIIANDLLSDHLQQLLRALDAGHSPQIPEETPKRLKWKGPKVGLVEFGYACKEAGALDESLQEIFECLGICFSVELKNTSRTFQEIISRKKEEAIYLDKLTAKLKDRRDKLNQNYKPSK